MHTVYILRSNVDGNLYIGCTSDVAKRLEEHNSGKVISTKHRKPLALIYKEVFQNRYDAYNTERFYKTAKGKKVLLEKMKHCGIV